MFRRLLKNRAALPTLLGLAALFLAVPHFAHANVFDLFGTITDLVTKIYSYTLELVLLPLAAGVLYLVGYIFDSAVYFSLHTAYIFGLSPAIDLGWVIVRDIMNIFFIFILIYISLGTIVNGLRFGTTTMLKNVVIAALLINFSLFITKAVIDVSNIFGNWLYGGVQNTLIASTGGGGTAADHVSLSGLIVGRLHIVEYWKPSTLGTTAGDLNSQNIVTTFVRLAIVLAATYIFLYAAVIFITRAITLLFLLVFAPVGFMGDVLPQIGEYSKEWRSELTTAAMFPIVFMLMLYISLQFINGINIGASAIGQSSLSVGNTIGGQKFGFDIAQIFQYFLIIFLLHATLKVSKKYAGELGNKANGIAESLGKLAIGASTGVAGLVGRRVIGAAASSLSNNATMNDMAAGKVGSNAFTRFGNQVIGKGALGATRGLAKSSFDVRGVETLGNIAGIKTGDAGGKDGFKGAVKAREEKEKKYAEEFGDSPEGIERRMAYAEDRRRSIFTKMAIGGKAAGKIGDKIRGDAGTTFTKGQTEKAKNETQDIKNQIVAESMAVETLNRANKMDEVGAINSVLKEERLRAERMAENSRKNPKNELIYNRYDYSKAETAALGAEMAGDANLAAAKRAEMRNLQKEFDSKTSTMLEKEKNDLLKADNKKVTEIADLEKYVEDYKKELEEVEKIDDIQAKKSKIASITGDKGIIKKRIGKPSTDWVKPTETEAGYFKTKGEGLSEKLQTKKIELEKARREQAVMEGKEGSKKPITGDTEARKEGGGGKEEDDGNP